MENGGARTVLSALGGNIIIDLPRQVVKRHLKCCARSRHAPVPAMCRSHWNGDVLTDITVPYTERIDRHTIRIHLDDTQLLHLFSDIFNRMTFKIFRDSTNEHAMSILQNEIPDLLKRINFILVHQR